MASSLAVVVVLSIAVASCGFATTTNPVPTRETENSRAGIEVTVAPVKEGTTAGATYSGEVKAKAQVNVAAKMMGRIEQMLVDVGSEVKAGDTIATLERSTIDAQVRQAEAALTLARNQLAQMEAGARAETVAQAEANLRAAEARMAELRAGPTPEQLQAAEAQVRLARNQLYSVQTQADAYLGSRAAAMGQLVFTPEMKEAQSGVAWEQVQLAEAQLAQLKAGPTAEQLAQAQAAVDAARAQLELTRKPFGERELEVARAQVAQAQAAVDLVNTQAADTVVTSPLDGVVAERYLSVGSLATPGTPIVVITNRDLEVSLTVEETRSGDLWVGQAATVVVGAYQNEVFEGVVSSVAPTVDPRTRTVAIKVAIKDPEHRLKAGMFARIALAGAETSTGVFVPEKALIEREGGDAVFVVTDGRVQLREVRIGTSDGGQVQVQEGLVAGETVVLDPPVELKDGDAVAVVRTGA